MLCWLNDHYSFYSVEMTEMTRDCQSLRAPSRNSAGLEPTLLFLVPFPFLQKNPGGVVSKETKPSVLISREILQCSGILTLGNLKTNDPKCVGACL